MFFLPHERRAARSRPTNRGPDRLLSSLAAKGRQKESRRRAIQANIRGLAPGAGVFGIAWVFALALLLLTGFYNEHAIAAPLHPLDPLTVDELSSLKNILESSRAFSTNTYFGWIELEEPPKELLDQYVPHSTFPRVAHLSAIDYEKKTAFSVTVDLRARRVVSAINLKDLQPGLTPRDVEIASEVLDNNPQVKAALVRRGLSIPGQLSASVKMLNETIGDDPSLLSINSRLMQVLFLADQKASNQFNPVVDGVMAIVDLYERQVVRLVDEPGEPIQKVTQEVLNSDASLVTIRPRHAARSGLDRRGN